MKKKRTKPKVIRISQATHKALVERAANEQRDVTDVADRLLREALDPSRPMTT